MTPEPTLPSDAAASETASFGFREVPAEAKAGMVRQVFDSVAARYDVMNDLMSLGVHRLWKSAMVDALAPRPGMALVDVAGGTGDIAFRLHARTGGAAPVTVCDINHAMLSVGRDRATDRGILSGLSWVAGDAETLPFADRRFDAYTIAFGLRNVTRIDRALAEARRVLRPGGRFLCLEFSRVVVPVLDRIYDGYSATMLPTLGGLVAGDKESYRYLHESIRRHPPQQKLADMMTAAGFARASWRNFSGGIVALHSGWRV
ncbi:MAG: bifunctional demethylmenaquinone methyltransferase/2-methoxy-6-polyprenyl-1,4-benzoquinol methylase UbiE [Rhodospirillales bacterium]|nr:bifunctional demethylmenaquinone methyltransferase/2-methoxy-6-polyprenyl-1,4-benzoquinol methylase UbiE [Rhodospirillales bacterium]QQS15089.1 MAG: bifunctional demethylmenaquinone methyltransferase/2-methoxy-6-polyprenyl-1,4-benzoquinol methylase UbiE [Rhodospirillales bacterium]